MIRMQDANQPEARATGSRLCCFVTNRCTSSMQLQIPCVQVAHVSISGPTPHGKLIWFTAAILSKVINGLCSLQAWEIRQLAWGAR